MLQQMLASLAALVGVALGCVVGVSLVVPVFGNRLFGAIYPRRIAHAMQRRLATLLWAAMAGALVLAGAGQRWGSWPLIGLGCLSACAAVALGVRLRVMLAREAQQHRRAQEERFRKELDAVLHEQGQPTRG